MYTKKLYNSNIISRFTFLFFPMKTKTKWRIGGIVVFFILLAAVIFGSPKFYKGSLEETFRPVGTGEEFTFLGDVKKQQELFEKFQKDLEQREHPPEGTHGFIEKPKQQGWIVEFKTPALLDQLQTQHGENFLITKDTEALQALTESINELKATLRDEHTAFLEQHGFGEGLGESFFTLNSVTVDSDYEIIESLKNDAEVKGVYPNLEVKADLAQSVPMTGAPDVWQLQDSQNKPLNGKGIKIGIIDTGIDYTHHDIRGNYFPMGYDFVNNDADPMDDNGHGTHVAATAAGTGDSGFAKGVAPKAGIVGYKVLNRGGWGYNNWIIGAMERSIDPNQDGNLSDHLDVINMSLGGGGTADSPTSLAADRLMQSGVIAVLSAGNRGYFQYSIGSPGASRQAITVGAVDKTKEIARFSSQGPSLNHTAQERIAKPDLVAPGVGICAAKGAQGLIQWNCREDDTTHTVLSGTSMSSPHVAGAAALLRQKYPRLPTHMIKNLLISSSNDLGEMWNRQGGGSLNLNRAVATPVTIVPNSIGETISHTLSEYRTKLTFANIENNAVRIKFQPTQEISLGQTTSNPQRPQTVFQFENFSVSVAKNDFCLESRDVQEIDMKADISNVKIGVIAQGKLEMNVEVLSGNCQSGTPTGKKFTQQFPIRLKKAYEFTVKVNPIERYFPGEFKWFTYYLAYPGTTGTSSSGVTVLADGTFFGGASSRRFYAEEPQVDVVAIVETWHPATDDYSVSILGRGIDIKQQNKLTLSEKTASRIDKETYQLLQNYPLDPYYYSLQIRKERGNWFPYWIDLPYVNHNPSNGGFKNPLHAQIHTYVDFQKTYDIYSVHGSLQGVPIGKNWHTTDAIGLFPFSSNGYIPSKKLVKKTISAELLHPKASTEFYYYRELQNQQGETFSIYSGTLEAKTSMFDVIIPGNDIGFFNARQIVPTPPSGKNGSINSFRSSRPPFSSPEAITKYFYKIELLTNLPYQPLKLPLTPPASKNICKDYPNYPIYVWLSDHGLWMYIYQIPYEIFVRNALSPTTIYGRFSSMFDPIDLPNIEGILELVVNIPAINFNKVISIKSKLLSNGCYTRYIDRPPEHLVPLSP